jgi:CheY-like chemotaxis protein
MKLTKATTTPRILLIEDDAKLRDLYERRFDALGNCAVTGRGTGARGLDALDDTVDVIVLDWNLPDADGRQMLEAIERRAPDTPLIVNSGTEYPDDVAALPCDEYLMKPVTREQWEATFDEIGLFD